MRIKFALMQHVVNAGTSGRALPYRGQGVETMLNKAKRCLFGAGRLE